jgi:hypothetical protein
MRVDLMRTSLKSSFLSCEKDFQTILRRLFVESKPYDRILKKLLVINTKDCLDAENNEVYKNKIDEMSVAKLRKEGYIKFEPVIKIPEDEEVKTYIIISFDNFLPTNNPEYRDCTVSFDILCHTDSWDIGNYRLRPLKIAGYIDGILNNARLSGIGELKFRTCKELILDNELAGYSLTYEAVHGNDDRLEGDE